MLAHIRNDFFSNTKGCPSEALNKELVPDRKPGIFGLLP